MEYKNYLICLAIGLVVGFFIGRATIKTKTEIKYVKGETIHDTIPVPTPYNTYIPIHPVLPVKTDTIQIKDTVRYTQVVDTAAILSDYIIRRDYNINVFDNKNGKLKVFPSVQYNKLSSFSYEYTPIVETQTINKEKIFTPFVGIGYNSFNQSTAGIGIYYYNLGLEANYNYDFKLHKYGYGGKLLIKF
jgi:hypothetical protein